MTPREASMIEGQILDPADFPWQDTEAHMTALQAKGLLKQAVANMAAEELDASIHAIQSIAMAAEQHRREEAEREQPEEVPQKDISVEQTEEQLLQIIDKIHPPQTQEE